MTFHPLTFLPLCGCPLSLFHLGLVEFCSVVLFIPDMRIHKNAFVTSKKLGNCPVLCCSSMVSKLSSETCTSWTRCKASRGDYLHFCDNSIKCCAGVKSGGGEKSCPSKARWSIALSACREKAASVQPCSPHAYSVIRYVNRDLCIVWLVHGGILCSQPHCWYISWHLCRFSSSPLLWFMLHAN